MRLLPAAKPDLDSKSFADLSQFISEEFALNGPLGYFTSKTSDFLTTLEKQDTVGFGDPLLNILYKLIRHKLANSLTITDGQRVPVDVKLKYPSAIVISALIVYMVDNSALWTNNFKSEFVRLTSTLSDRPETQEVLNFFGTYLPPIKSFLSISHVDDLTGRVGKPLDLSLKNFNFHQLVPSEKLIRN